MSNHTIRAARKRAQQRVNRMSNFTRLNKQSQPEDRTEALSAIKHVKYRG